MRSTFRAVLPPFVPAPYVAVYVWHLLPLAGEHGRVKLCPSLLSFFLWCGGGGGVSVGGRGRSLARLCLRLAVPLLEKNRSTKIAVVCAYLCKRGSRRVLARLELLLLLLLFGVGE